MSPVRRFDLRQVSILLLGELRDAWRNRWFLLYSAVFAALALAMSWIGLAGVSGGGFTSLGRTAASLISLVTLIVASGRRSSPRSPPASASRRSSSPGGRGRGAPVPFSPSSCSRRWWRWRR